MLLFALAAIRPAYAISPLSGTSSSIDCSSPAEVTASCETTTRLTRSGIVAYALSLSSPLDGALLGQGSLQAKHSVWKEFSVPGNIKNVRLEFSLSKVSAAFRDFGSQPAGKPLARTNLQVRFDFLCKCRAPITFTAPGGFSNAQPDYHGGTIQGDYWKETAIPSGRARATVTFLSDLALATEDAWNAAKIEASFEGIFDSFDVSLRTCKLPWSKAPGPVVGPQCHSYKY